MAAEFGDQFVRAVQVFVGGHRRQKVAPVGQAVRANRPQVGQAEVGAEVLAHIATSDSTRGAVGAAGLFIQQFNPKAHTARDDDDFLRLRVNAAQLGDKALPPHLRHDQQLAVGVVEHALRH